MRRPVLLLLLAAASCAGHGAGHGTDSAPDAVTDAGEDAGRDVLADLSFVDAARDTAADRLSADEVGATPPDGGDADVLPAAPLTALILDFEMRHVAAWRFLIETLEALGFEVTYRRWYPHVTGADVDDGSGASPWRVVFVGGGSGPGGSTPRMRLQDADRLGALLDGGGALVLLPRNAWQDGYAGQNEWLLFNRILEAAGVGVRIQRDTVVGNVVLADGDKPPLHRSGAASYPGGLEWTLELPLAWPAAELEAFPGVALAFAAGWSPSLTCDSDNVAVLARTHPDGILWHRLEEGSSQVEFPGTGQPLAALAPAGAGRKGLVLVLSRALVQLPAHTEQASDKPLLSLAQLANTATFASTTLFHLRKVLQDRSAHVPQGCHVLAGEGMFSAAAAGLPPLGDGPVALAPMPPPDLPVPEPPPVTPPGAPSLEEGIPPPVALPPWDPDWLHNGRIHLGYGGWGAEVADQVAAQLVAAAAAGMDSFVVTVGSQNVAAFSDTPEPPPPFEGLLLDAEAAGVTLYLGTNSLYDYSELAGTVGAATGALGQTLTAPPPASAAWWQERIHPLFLGAATLAAAYPSVRGLHIDTELYGAGSLVYEQGTAFDDGTWALIGEAVAAATPDLAAEAAGVALPDRLPWLVDHGLVGLAYAHLEDQVAGWAKASLTEARTIAPDLEVAFYAPVLSTAWYYRGLARGLGTPTHPVLYLTYDSVTRPARDLMTREGIHVRTLGGLIGVLFTPEDFETGLVNSAKKSDGYWQFQFTDFPAGDDPGWVGAHHGPASAYWEAMAAAKETLDGMWLD